MSKIIFIVWLLIISTFIQAETIWLDDSLNTVSQEKSSLYIKEQPVENNGVWFVKIYDKKTNRLIIEANLTDPDISKQKFVDNKWIFYCSNSCKQERMRIDKNTIEVWDYFQTGELYRHFFIVNGVVEGKMEIYHGASSPMRIEDYKNDKREGFVHYFTQDGKVISEEPYTNNKKEGLSKEWNKDGKLVKEVPYKDNVREGISKKWNDNGQLIEEVTYKNDLQDGASKKWNDKGILVEEGYFKANKKNGWFIRYFNDTGKIYIKEQYRDGKPIGVAEYYSNWGSRYLSETKTYDDESHLVEQTRYDEDGSLYSKQTIAYAKNTIVKTRESYQNGIVRSKEQITEDTKSNTKQELHQQFDQDKKLIYHHERLNDRLNGLLMEISHSGNKKTEYYKNGYKDGSYLLVDTKGEILEKGIYKNDKPIGNWKKLGYYYGADTDIYVNYDDQGKMIGDYLEKGMDGKILKSGKYKNNHKIGKWIEYTGKEIISSIYDDQGHYHGLYLITNLSKEPIEEINYEHGKKQGKYSYWINNKLVATGNYKDNLAEGYWIEYGGNPFVYNNNDTCKGIYKSGHKIEKWQCFAELGYMTLSVYYDEQGQLQGHGYFFTHGGRLEEIAHYKDNKLDGKNRIYDTEGNVKITMYEMGNKVITPAN